MWSILLHYSLLTTLGNGLEERTPAEDVGGTGRDSGGDGRRGGPPVAGPFALVQPFLVSFALDEMMDDGCMDRWTNGMGSRLPIHSGNLFETWSF